MANYFQNGSYNLRIFWLCLLTVPSSYSFSLQARPSSVDQFTRHRYHPSGLLASLSLDQPTEQLAGVQQSLSQLTAQQLATLQKDGYLVLPNFLSPDLTNLFRSDLVNLRRTDGKFRIAKIGQDATNTLNTQIRVAETCFLPNSSTQESQEAPPARQALYQLLGGIREKLDGQAAAALDPTLDEWLYVYYPEGGFYRRHVDAVPGSASVLREVSLLLYLNTPDWEGGQLRIHRDSGGDALPAGEEPNFVDIDPEGGTLVLMESSRVPHEVLDTHKERFAVVGWYNRAVSASDISSLMSQDSGGSMQVAMMAVAAGLVTVGLMQILS